MSAITDSEKIKKYLSKKMLLGFTALLMGVAIIFVCSIVPLMIDPTKWNSTEFISDEIIIVALTIMGEVSVLMIGQSYNSAQDVSKISRATVEFNHSLENHITSITAFAQWVKMRLEKEDQHERYVRLLHYHGVENMGYLDLDYSDLKQCLEKTIERDKVYYRQITKKQYKLICDIKQGKYVINFVDAYTYIKLSKIDLDKTVSEKMANQQKKKSLTLLNSVFTKTLLVICTGLIFGALVPTGDHYETATALMKLFTRLFSFSSAGFCGFFVGQQINDIEAEYILEKVEVHKRYASDKDFKPLDEQQLARQEFARQVQEDNKEYMKQLENNSNKIEYKGENYGR